MGAIEHLIARLRSWTHTGTTDIPKIYLSPTEIDNADRELHGYKERIAQLEEGLRKWISKNPSGTPYTAVDVQRLNRETEALLAGGEPPKEDAVGHSGWEAIYGGEGSPRPPKDE